MQVHIVLSTSCTGQSSLGDVAKLTEGDVLHVHQGDEKAAAEYMRHRVADMPSEVLVRKEVSPMPTESLSAPQALILASFKNTPSNDETLLVCTQTKSKEP